MNQFLIQFINIFTQLLIFAIFARVVLSWISVSPGNRLVALLRDVTEPVMRLARRITPRLGMIDISPVIAIIGLEILRSILIRLLV